MIKEVTGDILLSKADLLAHGISAFDPFDSGLALALRERWPSLVKDYRHDTHSKAIGAGELWALRWGAVVLDGPAPVVVVRARDMDVVVGQHIAEHDIREIIQRIPFIDRAQIIDDFFRVAPGVEFGFGQQRLGLVIGRAHG